MVKYPLALKSSASSLKRSRAKTQHDRKRAMSQRYRRANDLYNRYIASLARGWNSDLAFAL